MRTRPVLSGVVLCATLCSIAGPVLAQSSTLSTPAANARLQVTARDADGVLPGATVTIARSDVPLAPLAAAITDAVGVATIDGLAAGTYTVRVSFLGFADATRTDVVVEGTGVASVDVALTLAQFSAEVTVTTANRREQVLLDVADPIVLIDQAQIADTGARTAKDLLSEQTGAGIQVQAGGGQGHLSLNGIPNSGVLVLIDGRRYLGKDANGNLNLEDLPLTGVDRVEVVKGAGSALYGSDAIGGVVNFVTRQSRTPGVTSLSDISGGSYGDWRVNQTLGWRGSRGGVSGSAGYREYDGFDLSTANPQTIGQPPSTWWSGTLNADTRLGDRVLIRAAGDYSKRDIDNYFFSGATQLASTVYDSQRDLTRYSVSPTMDVILSPSTTVTAAYTGGWYLRDETRVFVVGGRVQPQPPWREWNDELRLTASHAWRAFGMDHPLQGGFERRHEQLSRGSLDVVDPARDITTAWFQQEVRVGNRLTVAAGVRYDDFSDFGSEWSPKASLSWRLADQHRLRLSAGQGYRPPYFGELYLFTPPAFVGNPNLQPETANTVNAGYAWATARVQLSADYYLARVENGITFDLSRQPFTYANLRTYTSQGTNLGAAASLPGGFTPSLSYTLNRREDQDGIEIGGFARHSAFLKLLWASNRLGLRANIRGQVLGDVPPAPDGSYQSGYQVWNAQVSQRLLRRGPNVVSLYLQMGNLFDEGDVFLRNAQGQPIEGDFQAWLAPRTFLAGLTIDLGGLR
ncbi:TonB-dependent receptor [Luteitalea sp.]|uniref:TonB-dependent receptor n=1 Tax=Luteitalea sp. TaxID=2004800 RepID=UPI0025C56F27|nr:TonB-dependent receptor [Luteitalea sp.]